MSGLKGEDGGLDSWIEGDVLKHGAFLQPTADFTLVLSF